MEVKIDTSWKQVLKEEFRKDYFLEIVTFLKMEKLSGKTIYPPGSWIFNAFNTTPFDQVKVVLLGQDPYHGLGQAMGLSFSVPEKITIPPSLYNIYKELKLEFPDRGYSFTHGDLTRWFDQEKIFLVKTLNCILQNIVFLCKILRYILANHNKCGV